MRKIKFFSIHFIRVLWRITEFLSAFLIVCFALAFWYLSSKPVNVQFLLPRLTELVLSEQSSLKIQADSAFLSAKIDKSGLFHIEIQNLTVMRADKNTVLELPELTASYGLWKILTLNYTPDTLTVERPFLQLMIDQQGSFYIENPRSPTTQHADNPQTSPSSTRIDTSLFLHQIRSLKRITLQDADISFHDERTKQNFSLSDLNFTYYRRRHKMPAEFSGILMAKESLIDISGNLMFNTFQQNMDFDVTVDNVHLPALQYMYEPLKDIDLTLKGNITGQLNLPAPKDIADLFSALSFSLKTQKGGTVSLPAPLTNAYHVENISLNGHFTNALEKLIIDNSAITLKDIPTAPIQGEITGIDTFLKSSGGMQNLNHIKTQITAQLTDIPMAKVPALWPSSLGPDAHTWTKENITAGTLTRADWVLQLTGAELNFVEGKMDFKNAKITYLDEMPAVENVAGKILLTLDTMSVALSSGHIGNVNLKQGEIFLTQLQDPVSNAHLTLSVAGPADEILRLIDYKPLEFAKMFDINPKDVTGKVSGVVDLKFPLIETLTADQVQALVNADMTEGTFILPFKEQKLTQGTLNLKVNNQMLNLSGTALWNKNPIQVMWDEYFIQSDKQTTQTDYKITFNIQESTLAPFIPDIDKYIAGDISGTLLIQTLFSGTTTLSLESDLTKATIPLYPISYLKKKDEKAVLKLESVIKKSQELSNTKFSLKTAKLNCVGDADWKDGIKVNLTTLTTPETNISGGFTYLPEKKLDLTVKGTKWNISNLFKMPYFKKTTPESQKPVIKNSQRKPIDLNLSIKLDELTRTKDLPLKNISVNIKRDGFYWKDFSVALKAKSPLNITFNSQKGTLRGSAGDVGDLANRLGLTPRLSGGTLSIKVKQPPAGGFKGTLLIENIDLKEPGFLTQALSILGILDAITGQPLNFKEVKAPFEWTAQNSFYIEDSVAHGTTLGITFKGQISSQLNLSGSVIPAYAINSLPGKIPVIGALFRDSAGGGLMGVKYTTKGSLFNPEVNFNPLSSVAPGALGRLFN